MEIWKDINGYIGIYQVSNMGNVRSLQREEYKCRQGYRVRKGRQLKPGRDKKGYLLVGLRKDGKCKTRRIHRLVAEAFIPNPNNLPQINHKDENKCNNTVDNLEWCTPSYNINYGKANMLRAISLKKLWERKCGEANEQCTD